MFAAFLTLCPAMACAHERPLRVVSLDMCADAYALGLLPVDAIAAVSPRAVLPESYYAAKARTHRVLKPSLEAILALRPDAVIRTWGGDISLIEALRRRGIKIIQINDVSDFSQARSELLRVGSELQAADKAAREAARMDSALAQVARVARVGGGRRALYLTPGGYTAGAGTWPATVLETLGFQVAARDPGFSYISPETFIRLKPDVYALGFYDNAFDTRHAPGRHPIVRKRMTKANTLTLPSTALGCGAWYVAYSLKGIGA